MPAYKLTYWWSGQQEHILAAADDNDAQIQAMLWLLKYYAKVYHFGIWDITRYNDAQLNIGDNHGEHP